MPSVYAIIGMFVKYFLQKKENVYNGGMTSKPYKNYKSPRKRPQSLIPFKIGR